MRRIISLACALALTGSGAYWLYFVIGAAIEDRYYAFKNGRRRGALAVGRLQGAAHAAALDAT